MTKRKTASKRKTPLIGERYGKGKGPFVSDGGGCGMIGSSKYRCDDLYENVRTGEEIGFLCTRETHIRMPYKATKKELMSIPGTKIDKLRTSSIRGFQPYENVKYTTEGRTIRFFRWTGSRWTKITRKAAVIASPGIAKLP